MASSARGGRPDNFDSKLSRLPSKLSELMTSAPTSSFRALLERTGSGKLGLRFLARAALWMIVLYGAYYYPHDDHGTVTRAIDAYLRAQAWAAAGLIRLFDGSVSVADTVIHGQFPLQIVKSCSSLDAQALYAAAVLAFPARPGMKALGLLAGLAGLTTMNLARIAILYFVGARAPQSFDAVHEELLPLVLVIFATLGFAYWARLTSRDSAQHAG